MVALLISLQFMVWLVVQKSQQSPIIHKKAVFLFCSRLFSNLQFTIVTHRDNTVDIPGIIEACINLLVKDIVEQPLKQISVASPLVTNRPIINTMENSINWVAITYSKDFIVFLFLTTIVFIYDALHLNEKIGSITNGVKNIAIIVISSDNIRNVSVDSIGLNNA